ncbi:unnamed protein product [Dovyalis caffra]|uniref:Uncharacterized protein n=1 Tax=Dovyalis caffra TaxID=77055 RepID=A0AAV1RMA2_9ROSI|nr:unnamed protein product [Dovyalis caffra]
MENVDLLFKEAFFSHSTSLAMLGFSLNFVFNMLHEYSNCILDPFPAMCSSKVLNNEDISYLAMNLLKAATLPITLCSSFQVLSGTDIDDLNLLRIFLYSSIGRHKTKEL